MALDPLTAREALLEIRRRLASQPVPALMEIDSLALAGLDRGGMENFELSDQLADRLAEAHKLLREFSGGADDAFDQIEGVLALPPDLETMVERRIGHA